MTPRLRRLKVANPIESDPDYNDSVVGVVIYDAAQLIRCIKPLSLSLEFFYFPDEVSGTSTTAYYVVCPNSKERYFWKDEFSPQMLKSILQQEDNVLTTLETCAKTTTIVRR
ncbi:hypothetical protein BGZ47_005971 [Haplosporangium gracile]|nr:hypothetical protein BGZ47_005971 [Haplosporangium gracile]